MRVSFTDLHGKPFNVEAARFLASRPANGGYEVQFEQDDDTSETFLNLRVTVSEETMRRIRAAAARALGIRNARNAGKH